jgi:hypothetical protein
MSQVTLQGNASGTGIFTIAAPNSNTNRTLNLPDAGGAVIVGTQPAGDIVGTTATQTLTNKSISGAQINSGTVAVARLGSGTPGSGNFLRGDGSWQTLDFTSSFGSSGYQKLPSGLIIQWGTVSLSLDTLTTVTLPIAFPNSTLNILTTVSSTSGVSGVHSSYGAILSNSQIYVYLDSATTSLSRSIFWFATGH